MKNTDINPHIRYAATHYSYLNKPFDSICYDCRFFFVIEGNGSITADNKRYSFSNNTAIFFPPGTKYHFHLDKNCHKIVLIVINFDLINDFSDISKSLGTAGEHNFQFEKLITYKLPDTFSGILTKKVPGLIDSLKKCIDEFQNQYLFYRETSPALLKLCLMEFIRSHEREDETDKLNPVLDYIHTHYNDTGLTNECIAEKFNYHPYYLSHLMKQHTGKSLHQYLISHRIKKAKENLVSTDDSINIIAWKSGFHSTAYFIKIFREQTGVTPGNYRKNHMQFLF